MKILVLQLKRIGDLILTTPALAALRRTMPHAHITLVIAQSSRELAPAIDFVDDTLVYGRRGGNAKLWWKLLFTPHDVCLDFTGTDRSALFSLLSKAQSRVAFQWVRKSGGRQLFYNRFVNSPVRDYHTIDHYLHLLTALDIDATGTPVTLHLPDWARKKAGQHLQRVGVRGPYAVVHPGTARKEKFWKPERWAKVIAHCEKRHRLPCVLTGGRDVYEVAQLQRLRESLITPERDLSGQLDLLTLAAVGQGARLFLSVDTGPMHLMAAFGTPQVALFGGTNPFHWRPRHARAIVLHGSVLGELTEFKPGLQPVPMSAISTDQVIRATDSLLAQIPR